MKHIRIYLVASVGLLLAAGSFLLSGGASSSAAPPPDKDVVVVNTPSNPVPVQPFGTTNVSGNVNISNQPNVFAHQSGPWTVLANQSGTWNVSLVGPTNVSVSNSPGSPLYVRDVDNPAQQPFQRELDAHFTPGSSSATDSLTVPAGKRLVIEFASETVNLPTGQHMWLRIQTTANGSTNQFTLMPSLVCPCGADSSDFLAGNQQVRLYADPGTTVSIVANLLLSTANTNTGADVVMSGHYVNIP